MLKSQKALQLDHCHHCGVDQPEMKLVSCFATNNHRRDAPREWCIYHCVSCGGAVLTGSIAGSGVISAIYPSAIKSVESSQLKDMLATAAANSKRQTHADDKVDAVVQAVHQ